MAEKLAFDNSVGGKELKSLPPDDKLKILDMYINQSVTTSDTELNQTTSADRPGQELPQLNQTTSAGRQDQEQPLQISKNAPFVFSKRRKRLTDKNMVELTTDCDEMSNSYRKGEMEDCMEGMNNGSMKGSDTSDDDRMEGTFSDSGKTEPDNPDCLLADNDVDDDETSETSREPLVRYGEGQPEVSKLDKIIAQVKQDLIKAGLEKEITTPTLTCKMKPKRSNNKSDDESQEMYLPKKKKSKYPPELDQFIDDETHAGESRYKCVVCGKGFFYKSHLRKHTSIHLDIKPFTCNICGKGFNQNSNMKTHLRTHAAEKPYSCEICSKGFNHHSSLQIHMRTHTGERPYTCKICNKGFNRTNTLKMHEITHSDSKPYVCSTCGKEFGRRYVLQRHILTHTGERPYICGICGRAFTQNGDLQKHTRIHTGDKPYICDICSRGFCQSSDLIKHRKIHKKFKPLNFDTSTDKLSSQTSLEANSKSQDEEQLKLDDEEHRKSHEENICFVCTACGKEFSQIENFQEHKKIHEEGMTKFETTKKSLSNKDNVNDNVFIKQEPVDVGEKLRDTTFCGDKGKISNKALEIFMNPKTNSFAKTESKIDKIIQEVKRNLQKNNEGLIDGSGETTHEEVSMTPPIEIINRSSDSGEKVTESQQNVDDPCVNPESDKTHLISEFHNNQVAITSDKPYICTVCGKGYNQLGTLTNHFLKHTDTEIHCHVCDICGVNFKNGRDLAGHKKTHMVEKPYKCTTCGKEFKWRWDLTKHMKVIHSDDRPYPCTACGKVFRQQCILQAHMRTHTGDKPYGCSKCGEGFSKSSELKKHVHTHAAKK